MPTAQEATLEDEVYSYIQQSPLTSEFRLQNPNLHHMDDEVINHGSLADDEREEMNIENSIHAQRISISPSPQPVPPPLPRRSNTTLRQFSTNSLKSQLKRLSLNGQSGSRLSLSSMRPRSTISQYAYSSPEDDNYTTISTTRSSSIGEDIYSMEQENEEGKLQRTPYWKYHVLKFGRNLYLTTNPDLKHVYCRNGPGFYVEVISNQESDGVLLLFREIQGVEHPPFMVILKFGDEFTIDGVGEAILQPLYQRNQEPTELSLVNYEFKYQGNTWNIGSIPRTRVSKMRKLRGREDEVKYIGKRNIYFYRKPGNRNSIQQDPPGGILGLFRPYEEKMKKKLLRTARNIHGSKGLHNSNNNNSQFQLQEQATMQKDAEYDLAIGTNVRKFFNTGDGLYGGPNPTDDTPNDNKLGWITVYENEMLQGMAENNPLFALVVGLTLAVGMDHS